MKQDQPFYLLKEITKKIEDLNFLISNCLDDDSVIDETLEEMKIELKQINNDRRLFFSFNEETQKRCNEKLFEQRNLEDEIIVASLVNRLEYCLDLINNDDDEDCKKEISIVVSSLKRFNYEFQSYEVEDLKNLNIIV